MEKLGCCWGGWVGGPDVGFSYLVANYIIYVKLSLPLEHAGIFFHSFCSEDCGFSEYLGES